MFMFTVGTAGLCNFFLGVTIFNGVNFFNRD